MSLMKARPACEPPMPGYDEVVTLLGEELGSVDADSQAVSAFADRPCTEEM